MMKLQQTRGKILTILLVSIFLVGIVFAIPGVPHQFYGEVKINGNPAPNNVLITAKVNGNEVAGTSPENGKYGYNPIFYVSDPNGNREGDTIEFYVNNVKAAEYTFKNGASTKLDLNVAITNFCGDQICDSGETCKTCEKDCGKCKAGGVSGSGGGGGSSGGGSSGVSNSDSSTTSGNEEKETTGTENVTIEGNETTCVENWDCSDWFECFNGKQKRTCVDLNDCGTENNKPATVQDCIVPGEEVVYEEKNQEGSQLFTGRFLESPAGITTMVLSGLVLLAIIILYMIRRKKSANKELK
jgi:hypothetical protein